MKVELNIEKDEDLRKYIKSLIKQQIEVITRDEIRTFIKEFFEKEKVKTNSDFNKSLDAYIKIVISDAIKSRYNMYTTVNDEVKRQVAEYVNKVLLKG